MVVYTTRELDPRGPHWPDVELTMQLGRAKHFSDITREDALSVSLLNHGLPVIGDHFLAMSIKEMSAKLRAT